MPTPNLIRVESGLKPKYKIENWSVTSNGDLYTPPELQIPVLQGNIYGHFRFPDGTFTTTSRIVGKALGWCVETKNSVYELGAVDPKWEEAFPNAKERLLTSLEKVKQPADETFGTNWVS